MLGQEEFTLDHPLVQKAKQEFEKSRYFRRCRLGFTELLLRFKENRKTFGELADETGISRQAISDIYDRWGQQFFGDPEPRRKARRMEFRRVQINREVGIYALPNFIAGQARARGFSIEPVLMKGGSIGTRLLSTSRLMIGNKKCGLRMVEKAVEVGRGYFYAKVAVTRTKLLEEHAQIFCIAVPGYQKRIFIIPSEVLLLKLFGKRKRIKHKILSIPLQKRPIYRNHKPRIDVWQYENAWHLLRDAP